MVRLGVKILFSQHRMIQRGGLCVNLMDLGIMARFVIGILKLVLVADRLITYIEGLSKQVIVHA